jgi:ABC-2 type transport system permease protein
MKTRNKMLIVLKHEFLLKLRSKSFIILTFLTPLLLSLTVVIPLLVSNLNQGEKTKIVIVDETGILGKHFHSNAKGTGKASSITYEIISSPSSAARITDSLKKQISSKEIEGYLRIPSDIVTNTSAKAILGVRNASNFSELREISDEFRTILSNERLRLRGIDPAILDSLNSEKSIEILKVTNDTETKDNGIGFAAGYFTGFLIYITLLIHGSLIMQSVIEEKSSRVIELLISSITPKELLLGKILGVCLAGMLQIAVWALMIGILALFALPAIAVTIGPSLATIITPASLIFLVLYFIGGFLIYATLYATVGATVEQASDAQSMTTPITILVMIPIFVMTTVIEAPSTTTSTILSLIPFFSPILMMARIYSETPPLWQIGLSFILMGTTFYIIMTGAAKIYRTGILMYGKKFTFKEVFKWLKYS